MCRRADGRPVGVLRNCTGLIKGGTASPFYPKTAQGSAPLRSDWHAFSVPPTAFCPGPLYINCRPQVPTLGPRPPALGPCYYADRRSRSPAYGLGPSLTDKTSARSSARRSPRAGRRYPRRPWRRRRTYRTRGYRASGSESRSRKWTGGRS